MAFASQQNGSVEEARGLVHTSGMVPEVIGKYTLRAAAGGE